MVNFMEFVESDEEIEGKKYYRNSLVKMVYSSTVSPTSTTPDPFAELRVFIVSERPLKIKDKLNHEINHLVWTMTGLNQAYDMGAIGGEDVSGPGDSNFNVYDIGGSRYVILGSENNREIDEDEAKLTLRTTGLNKPRFGKIYRYAAFYDMNGNIKPYGGPSEDSLGMHLVNGREVRGGYNESNIRTLEGYKFIKFAFPIIGPIQYPYDRLEYLPTGGSASTYWFNWHSTYGYHLRVNGILKSFFTGPQVRQITLKDTSSISNQR